MSKIKELRENPENNLNMVNILDLLVPDTKNKTKYVELLLRVFHNDIKLQKSALDSRIEAFSMDTAKVDQLNKLEKIYLTILLNEKENRDAFQKFIEFCEFNEKGAIRNNDLQTYKSFSDIFKEHEEAFEKEQQKLLEKQVIKVLDDDEWFAVIPLTYETSLKYGASTKWCTAATEYPGHYESYTKKGILIYCMNKKNKDKFAGYCEVKNSNGTSKKKDISFWNAKDDKVDGFSCGFSSEMYRVFSEQFKLSNPGDSKIPTIEELRKKNLGTTKPSMPRAAIKKNVTSPITGHDEPNIGEPEPALRNVAENLVDDNNDYSDIYNTIVEYMGGRNN